MRNKKIKICHIAHQLTGKADGVYKHLIMLFEILDKEIFEHILVYSGNIDSINNHLKSLNVRVYNVPEINKKFPLKAMTKLFSILRNERVNIIQAHLVKPYLIAGITNIFLKKKLIFNYHGVFIDRVFYSSLERLILNTIHNIILCKKLVDLWIFPSNYLRKQVITKYRLKIESKYYYNSYYLSDSVNDNINQSFYNEISLLKEENFIVGIIGRIDEWKRIDIALEVLSVLVSKKLNIIFVFVGDGNIIQEMKKRSEELNIGEKTLFYNFIPNIANQLKAFDLILFTSQMEGLPITIWESMYNAVPIISSDVGGIREILEGENCGIVYPFGDIKKCAEAIIDLYYDREKLKQLGMNGYKAIIEKYSPEKFKEFFETLYIELNDEK